MSALHLRTAGLNRLPVMIILAKIATTALKQTKRNQVDSVTVPHRLQDFRCHNLRKLTKLWAQESPQHLRRPQWNQDTYLPDAYLHLHIQAGQKCQWLNQWRRKWTKENPLLLSLIKRYCKLLLLFTCQQWFCSSMSQFVACTYWSPLLTMFILVEVCEVYQCTLMVCSKCSTSFWANMKLISSIFFVLPEICLHATICWVHESKAKTWGW